MVSHPSALAPLLPALIITFLAPPELAIGQVDMQRELSGYYENACGAELELMRQEWGKMGQNGVCQICYYESVSRMDAAALQQKVNDNAGLSSGILPRTGGHAVYERSNEWEDCLLRTRSQQLGVSLVNLPPPPVPPADPAKVGGDGLAGDDPDGAGEGAGADGGNTPQAPDVGNTGGPIRMSAEEMNWRTAACVANRRQALEADGLAPEHSVEAVRNDCVKTELVSDYGGWRNECEFEVDLAWCLYRPVPGTHSVALDCELGQHQTKRLDAYERIPALNTNAELIYYSACRRPGSSVIATGEFIAGQGMVMRCQPWTDTILQDPQAVAAIDTECGIQELEAAYALEYPLPAPGLEQPLPEQQQEPSPQPAWPDQGGSAADPAYDPYATQPPPAGNDTGQEVTEAALQLMQMYLEMQLQQQGGGDAGGWEGEVAEGEDSDACWSDGNTSVCQ